MSIGQGGNLNGFRPFTSGSPWNTDISAAAVDPNSTAIINAIGANIGLHPDFGSGEYQGSNIGIPYVVVGSTQPAVRIDFTAYGSESDPGPMPIPAGAPIEGDPNPSGDQHVLILSNSTCFLYELFNASQNGDSSWNAGSAAVWDLLSTGNAQRPWTWTSADAAGLPIFPGLARYDEVAAGQIQHALRFTLPQSLAAVVPPASHWAATSQSSLAAPMGMRLRLKSSFNVSGFSANVQVILNALKKYGMIMADNGSAMYISGTPDARWDNNDLHNLGQVPASAFEVVQMTPLYTALNVPQGAAPSVAGFSASPTHVAAGVSTTLSWTVSGASYVIVSPQIGAVRGSSVSVAPSQTTTYTLYATNQYGRTTATVTVPRNVPIIKCHPLRLYTAHVPPNSRVAPYIDWLRGFACLWMFQTHCYDAWLGGDARKSIFFVWSQVGGTLPAPLFLFLAGISVALIVSKSRRKGIAPPQIARTVMLPRRGNSGAGTALPSAGIRDRAGLGAVDRSAAGGHSEHDRRFYRADGRSLLAGFCRGPERRSRGIAYPANSGARLARHRRADFARHSTAVDELEPALAALADRVLCERCAQFQSAAGLVVPDFSLDRLCVRGSGYWNPSGERLGRQAARR